MENLTLPTRILIVNASRIIRATLAKHLHEHYQLCEEADGEAGWKTLLADHAIQLVIADLTMPLLDGYSFLTRVRSSPLTHIRDIPVLMISGDDETARERVSAFSGVGFITKGIGSAALLTRIDPLIKTATQNPVGDQLTNQAPAPPPENIEPQVQNPQPNLFTRKYIELQTAQAMSKAMLQDSQISVMMVSLNQIIELREAYGDEVLEQLQLHLTKILANTISQQESFGHYGDNQLAIVLPDTSGPNCESYAERLREALKASNIALHGQHLNLSISIGVANSPVDSVTSAGALLELASKRLKRTQQSAENQTANHAGLAETAASPGQPVPTLEQALNLLRTGHEDLLVPHLDQLGKRILPLLYFLAEKLSLQLPMVNLERRLLELEREKKYGSAGPQ